MAPAALLPALALVAGAAAGIEAHVPWRVLLLLLPALLVSASVAWRLAWPRATLLAITVAFGCCGFALGSHAREDALDTPLRRAFDRSLDRAPVPTRFLLTEDAATNETYVTLRARVVDVRVDDVWTPADGGVVLTVGGAAGRSRTDQWRRGRLLEAPITFRRPARYLNDGVPDFEREAALDGIALLGTIKSALLVDLLQRGTALEEIAAATRAYVRRVIARRVARHSALSAAIVSAVLIGDRTGLPDDIRNRLQAAGTYHVIAISGGNIAILATLLLVSLMPLGLSGRRAAFITLVLLLAYAGIVTAGPSVWRATLVAVVYLFARLLDHRGTPWQAMAVAGGLLVVFKPLDVRNAGFVLTFGATAALLHVVRRGPIGPRVGQRSGGKALSWLATSIASSAAVEIALLPVMATTFSRITVAGLLLNLIAVPAMAVVQVAGLVVICANGMSSVSNPAGWIAHAGAWAIVESARLVDVAPWTTFRVPSPSAAIVSVYYAGLALMVLARGVRPSRAGAVIVLASAALIVAGVRFRPDVAGLRLTMVDVGQGEAVALEVPGHHALMIDSGGAPFGGGGFDIGTRVVEPALWTRGLSRLDALLLTHGDPDHIGGATPLVEDFAPRSVWQGIPVPRAGSLQAVLARAMASGIPVEERRQGEAFTFGAARVLVLHPAAPDWERQRVRNDDSVVLEVLYGDVALLLTGDISSEIEQEIIPRLIPARTRVLKVAHHGSRTSTSQQLLDAWRPHIALISCGRANPFGHPAPEVTARLEGVGARIYRTDRDGEITLETDGTQVTVATFTGGQR